MWKRASLFVAGLLAVLYLTRGAATQHVKTVAVTGQLPREAETISFASVLTGRWTYRSFVNDPDVGKSFNDIRFGAGEMVIESASAGMVRGRLDFGPEFQLALKGWVTYGNPPTLRFQGVGDRSGSRDWVYDYQAYYILDWPDGVAQRPAIVGSVIRTKPHSGGKAPAGVVASFIAVRQDGPSGAPANKKATGTSTPGLYISPDAFRRPKSSSRQMILPDAEGIKADAERIKEAPLIQIQTLPASQRIDRAQATTLKFAIPREIRSEKKRLDVELVVAYADKTLGSTPVRLRTYNGELVGPTLRAKAGDTLYITLRNNLPNVATPGPLNSHHEWNTTNLHFHGLHVAPQGRPDAESDNVLLELQPGGVQKYEVRIPRNHVAGTFWYHAHKHGSTSAHVSSGMAGALIIERDDNKNNLDAVPEVKAATEKVLLFQQVAFIVKGGTGVIERGTQQELNQMFGPTGWVNSGHYTTVNGQELPLITLAPGEVQRWRMIHGGFREKLLLQLQRDPASPGGPPAIDFNEIAVDGLPLGKLNTVPTIEMYPGYRSDVLVKAPLTPGNYLLIDAAASPANTLLGNAKPRTYIAKVVVAGAKVNRDLPTPDRLAPHRLVSLDASGPVVQRAFYGINSKGFVIAEQDAPAGQEIQGEPYNPSVARRLPLGATEKWHIGTRNFDDPTAAPTHPFHIHTNPFEVISIVDQSGREKLTGGPIWRDTIAMNPGDTITFVTRYDDFVGEFVQHCHILDHEDQGMMQKIQIYDPSAPATPRGGANAPDINALRGQPVVLLFLEGVSCPKCRAQVQHMAREIQRKGYKVLAVSPETRSDVNAAPGLPLPVIADPERKLSRSLGINRDGLAHATVVLDRDGKPIFRNVGETPFMDAGTVLAALARARFQVVIAVRNTDTVDDDYLTWAPTPCQIRVIDGDPRGADVIVTLTNDPPQSRPLGGDVRFGKAVAAGHTAESESLTLNLKQDGTPVDFFMAGKKASTLTMDSLTDKGRDAVIEIHQGNADGPLLGTHAVMVRVRKDIRTLTDVELQAFQTAVNDLHRVDKRYEWYVLLHRLATGHGEWPDQAHRGSGFIAWHRAFLLQFERELQKRYPYVALPYWVQGEPQPTLVSQKLFSGVRLGTNSTGGTEVVSFDRTNPLYGWSIDLNHDDRVFPNPTPMGVLRRAAKDHNLPPSPNYRGWSFFQSIDSYAQFAPPFNSSGPNLSSLEVDPHNDGHNNVGPANVWMQNCRESNADPVFWVFHCNHDYLWAKWQWHQNRFKTDGSDPKHYWPPDAFADASADRSIPLGHHLKDKMWPWDGTTGQQTPVNPNSLRPNVNTFGPFPKAPYPFQWPTTNAAPRPGDVIDYLGIATGVPELGYCYDTVPYGTDVSVPRGGVPETVMAHRAAGVALGIMRSDKVSPDVRVQAAEQLRTNLPANAAPDLAALLQDKKTSATLRAEAFHLLRRASPKLAVVRGSALLKDRTLPATLGTTVIDELGHMLHFSQLSHSETQAVRDAFRAALTGQPSSSVQAAAVRRLASLGDEEARDRLVSWLKDPSRSALPLPEVVSLLRFFPNQTAFLRQQLASPNPEIVSAATYSLYQDQPSAPERRRIAADSRRAPGVRKAAIQSLMHDDSAEGAQVLIDVFRDTTEDLDLRAEAAAALRVFFQRRGKAMPQATIDRMVAALTSVDAGSPDATELGRLRLQAIEAASRMK